VSGIRKTVSGIRKTVSTIRKTVSGIRKTVSGTSPLNEIQQVIIVERQLSRLSFSVYQLSFKGFRNY
jgi:hypothetical protein